MAAPFSSCRKHGARGAQIRGWSAFADHDGRECVTRTTGRLYQQERCHHAFFRGGSKNMRLRAQQRTMLRSIFDSFGYQISIHIWRPGSMKSGCTRAKARFFFRLGDQRAEVVSPTSVRACLSA